MGTRLDFETARALLAWQVELGATEAICDAPIDRYQSETEAEARPAALRTVPQSGHLPPIPAPLASDPLEAARATALSANTLDELRDGLDAYSHCELKRGARCTVFSDGQPGARVMIIGEAPGREEDIQGKPFVGKAGQLLDAMFAAIGMGRESSELDHALYITNILPWRPPQNRDPRTEEIAMMLPFVRQHVALAAPDLIVAMGNISCQALFGRKGITRLRGTWTEAMGKPCLPMFHPAYLLRNPIAKRETWHDLLTLKHRLDSA